jgi:hypothetical protein
MAITPVIVSRELLAEDFEVKKFFLLQLTLEDLQNYEALTSFIMADKLLGREEDPELAELKINCEKFFSRRILFSVKTFAPHKKELEKMIAHLESKEAYKLVPFEALIVTYVTILPKGGERCSGFSKRAQALLKSAQAIENKTKFNDELILQAPVLDSQTILLAKVKVIQRWLLENMDMAMVKSELDKLLSSNGTDPLVLALNANYLTQMGRDAISLDVRIKLIKKAFEVFMKAVENGCSETNCCPGLFSEYLKIQTQEWNQLARYCPYPNSLVDFEVRGKKLASNLCNVIKIVPEKKYRMLAYQILRDLYTYWPSQYEEKVISYNDVILYGRLAAR